MLTNREFVPLVALLMGLTALSTDAMLPALPDIGSELGVAARNDVQYIVTAFFLGMGIGPLLFGPLSDCIGRKASILSGLALFMIGCVISVAAVEFWVMIAGRVLQGVGAAAPRVVSMALVRDQYEGRLMARILSFVMAVFITVPMVAPALGQGLLLVADWRAIFVALFIVAGGAGLWLMLRQPETLLRQHRLAFSVTAVMKSAVIVLGTRQTLAYTLALGFVFAPFVAYLSTAQQIFQVTYGVGLLFPLYFAGLALSFGVTVLINGYLVMRYGMRRLCIIAAVVVKLVAATMWVLLFTLEGVPPLWLFLASLLAVFAGVALLFGNLNALAMQPLGSIAGVGAAIVTLISTVVSVPLGGLIGYLYDGTLFTLMGSFALSGAAALAAIFWASHR